MQWRGISWQKDKQWEGIQEFELKYRNTCEEIYCRRIRTLSDGGGLCPLKLKAREMSEREPPPMPSEKSTGMAEKVDNKRKDTLKYVFIFCGISVEFTP